MIRLIPVLALALAAFSWLAPAWQETLINMHDASQHMEYAWLVPLLSLALLWQRRKELAAAVGRPAPFRALPLFFLAAILFFFGLRGAQTRFLQSSAVVLLLALPLACGGMKLFKTMWFPILLLAFIMPVGFLDNFTVPLRRASVSVTASFLNGLGIGVATRGTALLSTTLSPAGTPMFQMDVADPCSGIRSLVALFAGTAAYGAFVLNSRLRRWVLFLSSVPIAFLGNTIRLLLTAITSHLGGQAVGMLLHDNALFIVAPFYALCVFGLADWLKRNDVPKADLPPGGGWKMTRSAAILLVAYAIGLGAFRVWAAKTPPLTFEDDAFIAKTFNPLPRATLRLPLYCQNRACLWSQAFLENEAKPEVCPLCGGTLERSARAELDILPNDTQTRKAAYLFANGDDFTVSVVVAGRNRISIHRPELCLPAQGYSMSTRQVAEILPGLPMALFSLRAKGQLGTSGFAYVFIHSGGATVSNLRRVVGDSLERSLHNRIPRWGMVTITSRRHDFTTPEGQAALARFMEQWYPTLRTGHE